MATEPVEPLCTTASQSIGEEECTFQPGESAPLGRFDDYKWRGPYVAHLAFFKYCMLVQTKTKK